MYTPQPPPYEKDDTCGCCCGQQGWAIFWFISGSISVVYMLVGLAVGDAATVIGNLAFAILFFSVGGWLYSKYLKNEKKKEAYYNKSYDQQQQPLLPPMANTMVDRQQQPKTWAPPINPSYPGSATTAPPAMQYKNNRSTDSVSSSAASSASTVQEEDLPSAPPEQQEQRAAFQLPGQSLFSDAFRALPTSSSSNQKLK